MPTAHEIKLHRVGLLFDNPAANIDDIAMSQISVLRCREGWSPICSPQRRLPVGSAGLVTLAGRPFLS